MIEQKFAGVQGASFVNPYHGDSNQIYTPQDYTDVAKNIAKLASTTYAQIQDNAFRQGQIDQLANAVDTDRWLGKDAYIKGAKYSKAQVELQQLSGRVQDIVNKGIASGSSAEEVLAKVREEQAFMFETAEELRDTQPEASNNIINSLVAMQGGAVKNHAERLVQKQYEYKTHGDYGMVHRMITEQIQASFRDTTSGKPMANPESVAGTFYGITQVLRESALEMGLDPDRYIHAQLTSGMQAILVNADMRDENTVAFVNTAVDVLNHAQATGLLSAGTVQSLKTSCQQKITEGQQNLVAHATLLSGAATTWSPELDAQFNSSIAQMRLVGVPEITIANLMNTYAAKRARETNAVMTATYDPRSALPAKGSDGYSAAKKTIITNASNAYRQAIQASGNPYSRFDENLVIASSLQQHGGYEEAHEYIKDASRMFMASIDRTGSSFSADSDKMLSALYRLLTSDNAMVRNSAMNGMGTADAAFVMQYGGETLGAIHKILEDTSTSNEAKAEAMKNLGLSLHHKYQMHTTGNALSTGGGGDSSSNANSGVVIRDLFYSFKLPFNNAIGGLGIGEDVTNIAIPFVERNFNAINDFMSTKGIILTNDNAFKALTAATVLNKTDDGYAYICPTGRSTAASDILRELTGKNQVFDEGLFDKAMSKVIGSKTFSKDATATWDTNDVVAVFDPHTNSWLKFMYNDTSGQNYEPIPPSVIREAYYEEQKKAAQEKSDSTKDTIVTSVGSQNQATDDMEVGVDYGIDPESDVDTDVVVRGREAITEAIIPSKETQTTAKDAVVNYASEVGTNFSTVMRSAITAADVPLSFIGAHLKARRYSALFGSDGTYYDKLTPDEVSAIDAVMSDAPFTGDLQTKLKGIFARHAVEAIDFMERMLSSQGDLVPVKVSDGYKGKNTFYITNAIGRSCFGLELGTRIMTSLAEQEGMILQARATDPRYTKAKVIGIGYKEGYPAWDGRFKAAAGDEVALSRVTNEFAVYYFSNVPENFMKTTGLKWETAVTHPLLQSTMISLTDYLWHSGRNAKGYYQAMELVKKNDLDGAFEYLKKTAAYKQSGDARRQVLTNGLYAFNTYWNGTQR